MGILSKLKKGVSKAWSGVKKAVKGVAKGVKKVAKGVVTAMPGGQKLWKEAGRLGTKVMKGIGKISSKLGPIGMMALSFVLAPVMGPMISSLWSGFGAGAATMAASANAFVSTLGTAGSGIFAAGNWIGGTLGAMGNAITESASNIMQGNFSGAATSFASNMTNAFTGKAGMASVNAGAMQSATQAASDLVASGGPVDKIAALNEQVANAASNLQGMGKLGADTLSALDPTVLANANVSNPALDRFQSHLNASQASSPGIAYNPMAEQARLSGLPDLSSAAIDPATGLPSVSKGLVPTVGETLQAASYANTNTLGVFNAPKTITWDKTKEALAGAKSMLGGSGGSDGYQPYVPQAITSQRIGNASNSSGTGSSGFSLLGGVQGLEQSIRGSQQMMFG